MGVGDFVFDNEPPPALLPKALNYEKWGIADIMQLPAGLLPQLNLCLNYYHAIRGYRSARKSTDWTESNHAAWDLVSWYLAQRMERRNGNRNQ